ncbi:hypothetical protein OC861_006810 [Tilletia horrida]|nr:hypothetical protein OC861_006810 [Tilletia horrida]
MSSLWQLAEQAVRPQENTCEPPNPNQTTPWARRHRFMVVLKGEDLKAYVGMVAIKSLNVEERSKVDLTARAIKHAAEKLNKYPVYFAQLMNSKEGTKIESTRPMNAKPSTLEGYIVIIQQMVIFFWRAWKLGSHIGEERWQDCNGLEKIVTAVMRDRALADHVAKLGKSTDLSPVWSVGERVLVASMGSTLDTSPLALFLAAIGIEVPVNGNFKAAGIYTPLLSRLLYTLRLCFFAARVSELEDLQAQLDASEHLDVAEEFADAHTRALGSASKWSSGSRYIQGLRAFGMASAQAEGGRDQALWSEDGKQVMMDGNLITLEQVKCVMDDLIHLSVCKLDTLLQRANEPDTLRALVFDGLVDNPACSDPGMWFGTLQANKDLLPLAVYGEKILPDLVSVSKDVLTQKATLDVEWDAVQDLWQEETQFLRTLASTIHLTSGMPSRGSELFETTWQNSPGSRLRGICIGHNGEVFIDNTYSKVDYKATRLQQNVRFLHPTIGRVVVRYLCTVRQVSDALYMIKHGVRRYYLWSEYCDSAPRKETRWDSSILSRDLVIHAASRGMGPRVTISVWRQLLESIAHKFFRAGPMKDAFASMFKRVNDDHQPGDDDDLVSLGLEGYGDTTEDIAEVAADVMAGLRQRGQAGRAYQQDPFSAQSGRSDEMSWTFYGRNLSHRAGMDDGTMSSARWASRTYQAFFELFDGSQPHPTQETLVSSAPPVKRSEPKVILSGSTTSASQQETPRPSLKEATLALPPTWSFGSEGPVARLPLSLQISTILFDLLVAQESTGVRRAISPSITDAIHCIDRQITNCVVVSGTGTGKALTWQVGARRARMEGKFTVLVIPYVALLADVMRTCERKNIAAREWRVDTQADILASRPDVVVVSLNRVVSNDFLQWTARLEVRDAIRTVFVDECHVLVEETFRRSISEFARVTHILSEKQFVLLTATLPPALERDLERQICLPIKYLRDCTHRTNLQFSVEQARSVKDALVQAKVKIDQTLQEAKSGSQALVICKTVGEAVQAGSFLSCPTYHASLKEEGDEPHSSLAAFLGGSVKVLAGTTAAGVGIDISKIVLVIFLGDPYSIATFAQGAGRAGRDGTRAEVIVWRINSKKSSRTPAGPLPRSEAEALSTLLEGDVCMQQPLTGWLDGRVGSCIELGTEFCSVCRIEETLQTMPGDDVAGLLGYSDHADPSTTPEARSSSNVKTQPREETALPEAHLAPEERKLVRKGSFRDEPKSKTLQTPLKRPRHAPSYHSGKTSAKVSANNSSAVEGSKHGLSMEADESFRQ